MDKSYTKFKVLLVFLFIILVGTNFLIFTVLNYNNKIINVESETKNDIELFSPIRKGDLYQYDYFDADLLYPEIKSITVLDKNISALDINKVIKKEYLLENDINIDHDILLNTIIIDGDSKILKYYSCNEFHLSFNISIMDMTFINTSSLLKVNINNNLIDISIKDITINGETANVITNFFSITSLSSKINVRVLKMIYKDVYYIESINLKNKIGDFEYKFTTNNNEEKIIEVKKISNQYYIITSENIDINDKYKRSLN